MYGPALMDLDPVAEPDGHRLPRDATGPGPGLDARLAAALERSGHALRVLLWDQAKAHGLSPIQVQLLLHLAGQPPDRRRVGQLAAELDVRAPTVSDAVTALRRKGLVDAAAVEGDRRGQLLALTDRGARLADQLAGWQEQVVGELARFDEQDKARTLQLLLDVIAALQERGVVTVARMCTTCRFFARDVAPGDAHPHRCLLLDAPLAPAELRVDCAEHRPVS